MEIGIVGAGFVGKATGLLAWEPKVTLEEGLAHMAARQSKSVPLKCTLPWEVGELRSRSCFS